MMAGLLTPRCKPVDAGRWILALALVFGGLPAAAADNGYRFELTPYAAYRMGGSFSDETNDIDLDIEDSAAQGFIVNGKVRSNTQWEVLYGRQATDISSAGLFDGDSLLDFDIEYMHFGGTYLFDGESVRPFVAMTIGVTHADPGDSAYGSENFFSASLGGGWNLAATNRFGIRLEVRAFMTFVDNNSTLFCESNAGEGECLILIDSKTLTQWEARAGITWRF
jgi:hypothetical protein